MKKRRNDMKSGLIYHGIALAAALLFLGAGPVRAGMDAEREKVDLNRLMIDCIKHAGGGKKVEIAFWFPEEYWRASFEQAGQQGPEEIEQMVRIFSPFTVVAVVKGHLSLLGSIAYESEAVTRSSVRLKVGDRTLMPMRLEDLPEDLRTVLDVMKPVLQRMIGTLGQNMHFIVFQNTDSEGRSIVSARTPGQFTIEMGITKCRWRTPLGSLLPTKTCPQCDEGLSGAFLYCPFDGTEAGGRGTVGARHECRSKSSRKGQEASFLRHAVSCQEYLTGPCGVWLSSTMPTKKNWNAKDEVTSNG